MKKILAIIIVITISASTGCDVSSWQDIFTFKSIRSAKGNGIEDLEGEAEEYEKLIDQRVDATNKLGVIYKKLGEKYLGRKAWNSAIDSFEKAIGYGNNSSIVHYYIGMAYANRAKDISAKEDIRKAEFHYRRALKKNSKNNDASYGLGILLFYVKGNRREGFEVMKNLALKSRNYYQARFALGRFHYELGNPEKSLSIYEELHADLQGLADSARNKEYRKRCKENIERLMMELARKR